MNRSAAKLSARNVVVAIALLAFVMALLHEARGVECVGVAELASDVVVEPAAGWLLPEAATMRSLGAHRESLFGGATTEYELGPFLLRSTYIASSDDRFPGTTRAELFAIEGDTTWPPDMLSWVNYDNAASTFSLRNDARDGVLVLMAKNVDSDGAVPFRVRYHAGNHRFRDVKRLGIVASCILGMIAFSFAAKRRLRLLSWPIGEIDAKGNIVEPNGNVIAAADLRARFPAETAVLYRVVETTGAYRASQSPRVIDVTRGNHNDVKLSAAKLDAFAMCFAVGAIVSAISVCWSAR